MNAIDIPLARPQSRALWREFLELTKPRVVALMMFTAAVGMLMSTRSVLPWRQAVFGLLGIALMAAAAAAVNHLVDRRLDAIMARTRARPLPRGALGAKAVALFAAMLGVSGLALLLLFTNPLCALLTLASLLGYALVYSLYLKHATPQNIDIGGAAGAAPPLLGWVAITGQIDPGAWVLFLIIFIWTPPHFWALAIHRRDDYARAGVPMLPVTHGVAFTTGRMLAYTVALVGISLLPFGIGMSGWLYLLVAAALGAWFLGLVWQLPSDKQLAMPVFKFSVLYLFGLFAALLLDHYYLGL